MDFSWLPIIISIGIGGVLLCFTLYVFPLIHLLDFPERYGLTREKLPYPAGISIVVGFLIAFFLFFTSIPSFEWVILGLSIIAIVSFIDDRHPLPAFFRLNIQVGVALMMVSNGIYIQFLTNPTSSIAFHLPFWIGGFITIIWIVGCMNAINWLDGVPNLSVINGMLSSLIIGILSFSPVVDQPELGMIACCFAGILLAFVLGNFTKTRYILGDSGSMSIGFLLAIFSVFAGGKMATMLITMSIPIFDGIFVSAVRIMQKRSPFSGKDNLHLHDQLMLKNWKNIHIIVLYTTISLFLGVSVLFLETKGKLVLIFVSALSFFVIRWILLPKKLD